MKFKLDREGLEGYGEVKGLLDGGDQDERV